MSHFVQIKTIIKEEQHLIEALKDLHLRYRVGEDLYVEGYNGIRQKVDIVVDTGSRCSIGFKKTPEGYQIIADWWALEVFTQLREKDFVQKLAKQYAYNVIQSQIREQNLVIEQEQVLENGDTMLIISERG